MSRRVLQSTCDIEQQPRVSTLQLELLPGDLSDWYYSFPPLQQHLRLLWCDFTSQSAFPHGCESNGRGRQKMELELCGGMLSTPWQKCEHGGTCFQKNRQQWQFRTKWQLLCGLSSLKLQRNWRGMWPKRRNYEPQVVQVLKRGGPYVFKMLHLIFGTLVLKGMLQSKSHFTSKLVWLMVPPLDFQNLALTLSQTSYQFQAVLLSFMVSMWSISGLLTSSFCNSSSSLDECWYCNLQAFTGAYDGFKVYVFWEWKACMICLHFG